MARPIRGAVYGDLANDGHIHATVGDSLIMLAEWGKDGSVHSESVHQLGATTLDSSSPHYADQAALFAERRFKPVPFDRAAVLKDAAMTYRSGRD